jgi:hypothetical protein
MLLATGPKIESDHRRNRVLQRKIEAQQCPLAAFWTLWLPKLQVRPAGLPVGRGCLASCCTSTVLVVC